MNPDHYAEAEALLAAVPDLDAAAPQLQIALAQAHAILALAGTLEQLRTDYSAWQALQQ